MTRDVACAALRKWIETRFAKEGAPNPGYGSIVRAAEHYGLEWQTISNYLLGNSHIPKWLAEAADIEIKVG